MIRQLCKLNWRFPIIPPKWLRPLYKMECLRSKKPLSIPFECDFFGLRYKGDLSSSIDFRCFFYGAFEKGHLFFWRDVVESVYGANSVFLDVGANVGHHSLFMSKYCSAVHAVEPYDAVSCKIVEKKSLNSLTNLTVHNVGFGNKNEMAIFYVPVGTTNLGVGSFIGDRPKSDEKELRLEIVIGDEYVSREIGCKIDMIKMDVEGFEKFALAGLRDTLTQNRPVVVFEITLGQASSFSSNEEAAACFPSGYKFFMFDYKKDNKARRKKSRAFRMKGEYRLSSFSIDNVRYQADIIAFPQERLNDYQERFPDKIVH